jgi:hypothetical protein
MPRLSQFMVRAALLWLGVGFSAGGLVLWSKGLPIAPEIWLLRSAHIHMLLIGWMVQLAWGGAFWILPRLDAAGSRGDERPVWLCFAALNCGVIAGALQGIIGMWPGFGAVLRMLPALAGICYIIATIAFIAHAWRRVLPFRNLPRPGNSATPPRKV